jgi:hypothetical protein
MPIFVQVFKTAKAYTAKKNYHHLLQTSRNLGQKSHPEAFMYLQGFCIVAYQSPYKLHWEHATNRKFSHKEATTAYTPPTHLIPLLIEIRNIQIHSGIYPVLHNLHYYI